MELTEKDKEIIRRLSEKGPSSKREMEIKRRLAEGGAVRSNPKSKKRPRVRKKPDFKSKIPKNATEKLRQKVIVGKNTRALKRRKERNPFTQLGGKI